MCRSPVPASMYLRHHKQSNAYLKEQRLLHIPLFVGTPEPKTGSCAVYIWFTALRVRVLENGSQRAEATALFAAELGHRPAAAVATFPRTHDATIHAWYEQCIGLIAHLHYFMFFIHNLHWFAQVLCGIKCLSKDLRVSVENVCNRQRCRSPNKYLDFVSFKLHAIKKHAIYISTSDWWNA